MLNNQSVRGHDRCASPMTQLRIVIVLPQ